MNESAKDRLEAARAKRAELARKADDEAEEATEARDADAEEAMLAAETEYGVGRVARVDTDRGAVVLKSPHSATYRKFRDEGKSNTAAFEKLVRPCVLFPSKEKFDALCDELPATLERCANAVVTLAGFRAETVEGKP